eukprot:g7918.t1
MWSVFNWLHARGVVLSAGVFVSQASPVNS